MKSKMTTRRVYGRKWRRTLAFLLAFLFSLAGGISVYADSEGLSDTLWNNGNYNSTLGDMAGRRLYVYGLVDAQNQNDAEEPLPDSQISLASDLPVNRLEIADMLYRLCGRGSAGTDCPFTDVPEDYAEAVGWMYASGVTRGIGGDLYGTGDVTRGQFLTMLSRLFSWESTDTEWGTLDYENQMNILARENGLMPVGIGDGFTHGDAYLILLSLAEQRFPEAMTPVRAELSRPRQVTINSGSFLDAEEQIAAAMQYAPYIIRVNFTKDIPAVDLRAFRGKYDISSPTRMGEYPFTSIVNTGAGLSSCGFTLKSAWSYELRFSSYSTAYLASLDTADWLRCYADEAFSQSIAAFWEKELRPLAARSMSDYEKATAAQDLLCRVASYDWSEYDAITRKNRSVHPEAHYITGFLDGGVIVCDGYAKTYQWMLRCLGVDCFVVYGNGAGDSHAWNKVKIDGVWYNADVCWKDTGSGNSYFLKSDDYFRWNQHSFHDEYVTTVFASPRNYS